MLAAPEFDQIAGRLRAMSRDGGSIEAAQVKLIGLDEIREAAGPRWPRMRERVRSGSLAILSQHTGPDDVIVPAGDGFLIMLAEGSPGDTQRRCQKMKDALLSFYLGEEALAALRPEVNSRALTADGLSDLIASTIREEPRVVARGSQDEIWLAPVLFTRDRKLGATLAAPVARADGAQRIAYNPDFILDGRHPAPQDFYELDIAVLDAACNLANRKRAAGYASAIGVSVHATTMQNRRMRQSYLSWLAGIDPELRRVLFVTICEVERGTPLMSMSEWCIGLRAQVSRVCLEFHYSDHAIGSVGSTGAWAAGFHLPPSLAAQRGARGDRLRDQVKFWSRTLRAQGLRLVVHGFQDAAFLEEAGSLGADLLTSDAHWPFSANEAPLML